MMAVSTDTFRCNQCKNLEQYARVAKFEIVGMCAPCATVWTCIGVPVDVERAWLLPNPRTDIQTEQLAIRARRGSGIVFGSKVTQNTFRLGWALLEAARRWKQPWRKSFVFATASSLATARSTNSQFGTEADLVSDAKNAVFLAIDALGEEDWGVHRNCLGELLEFRHNAGRLTWVSTTLALGDLPKRYPAGFAERLLSKDLVQFP